MICGDNLKALDDLQKQGVKADLIYLDPPFFSNRHYEVIWGDEAEVRSFKDRWAGGINVYIEWMRERVVKMYDVLKDTGSFYLHCDWHASHYLKVMLDEIFSERNFQNEIIWSYKTGGLSEKRWARKHDTILFYTKQDNFVFNVIKEKSYLDDTFFKPWQKKSKELGIQQDNKGMFRLVSPRDVWDINVLHPHSDERLGYPTQKPEALLERIIKASSNEGDLVLDPFCGCGTAMAVAHRLKRKWVGIDISPTAIGLVEERLEKLGAYKGKDFEVIGMPTTIAELRVLEPFEFQNWVINEMRAKQSKRLTADKGINGYYEKTIFTERGGIQIKQSDKVGRNVVDNFESALRRGKYEKGFIIAFSFTKEAYEEVARVKREGLDINLITVEDLLLGKVKI
ncbi:MAG: DNA adenine methyltransferase YhdJ [candidate division WS2 bacterium]|nr:DNA adenine methyltransferase YhdJ [Candidatus Lithacetigena glycinireducens]